MESRYVFLDILRSALAGKAYEPREQIPTEQWEQILNLAQAHQLLPMVVDACYRLPGLAGTELLVSVRSNVRRQVFLQARKTGEFLLLYQKLREAGAHPLVVKGIICRDLYPQPDQRTSSDEDVLIRPEEFDLCHEVLQNLGMEAGEAPEHFGAAYEIPYRKKGSPLYIELHKSLFPHNSDAYSDLNSFFEEVHQRAEEETVASGQILTLSATDHLFYLICHAFKHFLHGGFGIRQVCDIALFARKHEARICWKQLQENCESIRAGQFAAAMFAIGKNHLGLDVKLPEFWQADVDELPMLEDLLDAGIYGGADMDRKHSSTMTLHAVARQKQGKDVGGGVAKSLFPKAASLEGRYPYLKKHPWLLPVAWVSRMVKFAARGGSDGAAKTVRIGKERIELLKQYEILEK